MVDAFLHKHKLHSCNEVLFLVSVCLFVLFYFVFQCCSGYTFNSKVHTDYRWLPIFLYTLICIGQKLMCTDTHPFLLWLLQMKMARYTLSTAMVSMSICISM